MRYLRLCAALLALMLVVPAVASAQDKLPQMPQIPFLEIWRASPHANVGSEAFIHWDKDGAVPVSCAACHSGPGYLDFLGADRSTPGKVDKPAPIHAVIDCVTCHNPKAINLRSVLFPSGRRAENPDASARCTVCHQGRQSTPSVNRSVAGLAVDGVHPKLRFINVHYAVAGATLLGTEVKGAYEYAGKGYHGRFKHTVAFNTCTECHDPHSTRVLVASCSACHKGAPPRAIRESATDYDGDGDIKEGIAGEITTLHEALGAAIRRYGRDIAGSAIAYTPDTHPYFFVDGNANGVADKKEITRANAYARWTPRLIKATYNYQFIAKDPGAYAHNPLYALQILYDSLEDLSAKVPVGLSKMTRPR
ncbi:MAG: hypothetical protein ACI82H_000757 [Alphaproteobacteria bacterium]|jgi:hypothetical protein